MERTDKCHNQAQWLTRTAALTALLIALQWATAGTQVFAGQYITGSLVNCVLAVAALFGGLYSGVVVALISPFCAFFLGIGPALVQLVPCIVIGNCAYVLMLWLLVSRKAVWLNALAVVAAAIVKFLTLYVAVVKILIPAMTDVLKTPQVQKFTAMFSLPQLITALIGGTLAMLLLPLLQKAIKR